MVLTRLNLLAIFCAFLAGRVVAQTSLYIPGIDPQPLSVTALGIGPGGRTTWEIQAGVTSGDFNDVAFSGTATLIEGPVDARFIWNDPANGYSIDEGCIFTTGIASCRAAVVSDTVITTSKKAVQTIVSFAVQGGGLPPPSSSPTRAPVSITPTPTPSNSGSSGSASATPLAQNINGAVASVPPLSFLPVVLAGLGLLWVV